MPVRFSARATFATTPNRLAEACAQAPRYDDLTVANPTTAGIPYAEETILAALADRRVLRYAPLPFGLPEARAAVAADYRRAGIAVGDEQVLLTASTSEAYQWLFTLLADPGDEILVPAPSYPLFDYLARFAAVTLVPYPLRYDGAWYLDVAEIHARCTDRSRAILVVSPNNPTGHYLKEDERRALLSLGLPIVADEVFARYPLREDPRRAPSIVGHGDGGLVFALSGLSKLAALPQMKCGWIVVDGDPAAAGAAIERLEFIADTYLSVSAPVQRALPTLLASRGVQEDAIRARTQRNLATLRALLGDAPASLQDVEGGWYATLRLPRFLDDEAFAEALLREEQVLVHPGSFFDHSGPPVIVVSLLTEEATFQAAIPRVLAALARGA